MTDFEAPAKLFDLPRTMSRGTALAIHDDLVTRWQRQHDRPIGDLREDLQTMRQLLFDPVSREERLRREIARLRPLLTTEPPSETSALLVRDIGSAWVVTPEGRVTIPCLATALGASREPTVVVDAYDIHAAEHLLSGVYRDWVTYRLDRVLSLSRGDATPMLPAAIATVLLLLFNGTIGRNHALVQPRSEEDRQRLDEALISPISAFARAIEASRRADARHWSLYNGYALSEARRRLGDALVLERATADPDSKQIYIAENAEDAVVDTLGRELRSRGVGRPQLEHALDAMLTAFEAQRPRLVAYGSASAKTSHIRRLRHQLVAAL